MPLSGTLDLTSPGANTPSGSWFLLGLDGLHYAITGHGGPSVLGSAKIGAAETLTLLPTIDETQWRLDLLSLGFAGHSAPYYCWPTSTIPAPGTEFFWILGTSGAGRHVAGVRYKIDATGTIVIDGGFLLKHSAAGGAHTYPGTCMGAQVVSGVLYAVLWLGLPSSQPGWYLAGLPLSGTLEDLTDGSWNTYITKFVTQPTSPGRSYFETVSGRYYQNRCSLFLDNPVTGNIGVLSYLGTSEVPGAQSLITTTGSEYWVIAPLSHTVVTSLRDDRALFGQPWADSGTLYTGVASALARNDYTAPTVNAVVGGDEIIFGRSFTDQPTIMRFRRYFRATATGLISYTDTFEVTVLGPAAAMDSVFAARDTIAGLLITATDTRYWHFGGVVTVPPTVPALCTHADDWGDPPQPCDVDWPKCELVPGNITVEAVSPSVSPGHAFSSFEQVLKADAGCWRIALENIPVWTLAKALLWREVETILGGRTGTICVPFYEALYSATPIAATVTGAWSIGVTRITVTQTAGAAIAAGMHCSVGERGYRVKSAAVSGGLTTLKIWPPLRDAIIDAAVCEFNAPHVRCRLERDDGMDINLELLRFGKASVVFVEDV